MLWWLVDNAATVYFLLGVIALALVALWWMNRQRGYLIALAVDAALIALVWLLTVLIVTDQSRLEQIGQDMAQGIRSRKVEQVFKHISKSFNRANHRAMTVEELRQLAEQSLRRGDAEDVTFSKFRFGEISRAKRTAQVEFWVHGVREPESLPIRCEADFVLEGDDWRMKGFKLFIGNTGNQYPFP
jgi:hypothetical protein